MNEPSRQKSTWVTSLLQSKATGWLAFGLLIVIVVAATMVFGGSPEHVASDTTPAARSQGTTR